ncbi:RDD family protein [Streptomyces sp. NRRL S-350]|uniref:RDD family protein n=1 Tax=Streptomyces sp. NRRL S-350 TaxID=1463902 RepID=UPI0004C0A8A6|nr:RDD family protein [Streptomyces sp. NRRL S-350]
MAQGYPPPQYGQNPYAQPQAQPYPPQGYAPQGYAPQPQQGYAPAPQPYPQQEHGGQQYGGYGQPQPQPYPNPYPVQPHPRPAAALPPCPKEAGGGRRFLAIVLDFCLAVGLGFAAAIAADRPKTVSHAAGHTAHTSGGPVVPYFVALVGVGLLASFLNQVVLARLVGFSVGKGIMAMRVVRTKRVMRPNTWRLTRRWLLGFVFLAVAFLSEDFDLDDGDFVGMRAVRWKHLREYRQAVAGLG